MKNRTQAHMALRAALLLLLLILVVWVADLGWNTFQLWGVLQDGRAVAQTGLENASLEELAKLAQRADPPLRAVRRDLRPLYPLFGMAQGLPKLGPLLGQVEPGLEAGAELLHAGVTLLPLLQPVWEDASATGGAGRLERLVQSIAQNQGPAQEARAAVERAAPYVVRLNPQHVPASLSDNLAQLQDNYSLILAGARLLPDVPALMGADAPQTYLVLAQNSDELRSTGGFISGMGEITLDQGRVMNFSLPNAYDVDNQAITYPLPPEPLQRYMLAGQWLARDANWSPDFPTAAQQAQALYTLSNGRVVNGVVAFDQTALQELLKALGPVAVEGFAEPLTAQNVVLAMRTAWNPGSGQPTNNEWYQNRKNFMSAMGKAIMSEMLSLRSPGVTQAVLSRMLYSMRAGHVQVYFNDPAAQAQLVDMDLDGSVRPAQGDFLMLVDWNFGFNKVDPLIQRSLSYEVDLSDPRQPQAVLRVHYAHTLQTPVTCRHEAEYGQVYEDMLKRCFWNYWRVYAVPGAQLTSVTAPPLPGEYLLNQTNWDGQLDVLIGEGGAQVFGGPVMLAAQGQSELVLHYHLPAGILQAEGNGLVYRLRLQKQAGLLNLPVQVRVIGPAGYRTEALSSNWRADAGAAVWFENIEATQSIALRFTPAE